MNYSYYEEIKSLGIDLYVGEHTYSETIHVDDSNICNLIINNTIFNKNINVGFCFAQIKEFSIYLRKYLQSIQSSIIDKNIFKERYNTNNDLFIHVRLGDLLTIDETQKKKCYHSFEYYDKACSNIKFDKGYIASDSIDHTICKRLIEKYNLIPVTKNEIETIQFGSTCKNVILSPGSFSYTIGVLSFYSNVYYSNDGLYKWYGDIFVFPDWYDVPHMTDKNTTYSMVDCFQNPIDKTLDAIFNKKLFGFYIELGGFDGITQSNTAFFEFNREWKGILIEPSPIAFEKCVIARPKSICFQAACVSNDYSGSTIMGDFNGVTMSSVNGARLNSNNLIEVPARTLESILDESPKRTIDFLSLDCEGYELNVLKGLNLNKYRPQYMLIEIYTDDYNNIANYLSSNNYILVSNLTNYNKLTNPIWDGTHNDYLFKDAFIREPSI
ncbi:MAG: FkbM family methyltransferase [Terrimicrobiaceae bacterium]